MVKLTSDEGLERLGPLFQYAQVGRCVNSVTHDVNNYLGAVLAYTELIAMDGGLGDESRQMLEDMTGAIRKCTDLVASMTGIARKGRPTAMLTDPAKIVAQVRALRDYSCRVDAIILEVQCDEGLPSVIVNAAQLVQALLYVVMNAEEAVVSAAQRLIRIRVRDTGKTIEIAVWNSGPEVPEADRDRIFERFYTTKEGEHLGLGLAFARDTAEEHNGTLAYCPAEGFVFSLPKGSDELAAQL